MIRTVEPSAAESSLKLTTGLASSLVMVTRDEWNRSMGMSWLIPPPVAVKLRMNASSRS